MEFGWTVACFAIGFLKSFESKNTERHNKNYMSGIDIRDRCGVPTAYLNLC
jgi:hypothetical protein